ncbi:MAG: hypothetical protein ABIW33_08770 [Sphingomicrobium sp.]
MRALVPFAAAFALASCAPQPVAQPNAAFARELAGYVAGPPQTCVTTQPAQNLRAVDSSTIAYGYGRTIYVNHLPGECRGLSPFNTISTQGTSGEYCRGDQVRATEPGAIIPPAWCHFGEWVPYRQP